MVRLNRRLALPGLVFLLAACTSRGQILQPLEAEDSGSESGGSDAGGASATGGTSLGGSEPASGGAPSFLPGPTGSVLQVSAGDRHSCAVVDGALYCWGANGEGALGLGDVSGRLTPHRVAEENDWTKVSCGQDHTCAIRGGEVYCWGSGSDGQLGQGDFNSLDVPTLVPLAAEALEVSAGHEHTCAVLTDGRLFCWGNNAEGQLAQNDPFPGAGADSPQPVEVSPGVLWSSVSAGQGHTCAIARDGALWCWGRNTSGILGVGTGGSEQRRTPQRVGVETSWRQVAAGQLHSCAVRDDGSLWCWGDNTHQQLMSSKPSPIYEPDLIVGLGPVDEVTLDTFHSCALLQNGEVSCSGRNTEGALGNTRDEATVLFTSPVPADDWTQFAAGRFHTCGIREGAILCSGKNSDGALGVADTVRRYTFTETVVPER